MKELLEERMDRQMEANNELFLSKIHHAIGKVSRGQSLIICQLDQDTVWNIETSPKFPFRQNTNWIFQSEVPNSSVFSSTLLRPSTGRFDSSSCHYVKWIWVVWKPARINVVIKTNHLAHPPFNVVSTTQKGTYTDQKAKIKRIWLSNLQNKSLSQ